MSFRHALVSVSRRALAGGAGRLAPLAAAATQGPGALGEALASGSASSGMLSHWPQSRPFASAEAVKEREESLPETTGWGSTRVGSLLQAKVS